MRFARSTGLVTADGIPTGVPAPSYLSGFDIVDGPGAVLVYDGSASGALLATHNTTAAFATIELNLPVRADSGLYVALESVNAVIRYA